MAFFDLRFGFPAADLIIIVCHPICFANPWGSGRRNGLSTCYDC